MVDSLYRQIPFWEERAGGGPITDSLEVELPEEKKERMVRAIALRGKYNALRRGLKLTRTFKRTKRHIHIDKKIAELDEAIAELHRYFNPEFDPKPLLDIDVDVASASSRSSVDADCIRSLCQPRWKAPTLEYYDNRGTFDSIHTRNQHLSTMADEHKTYIASIRRREEATMPRNRDEHLTRQLMKDCGAVWLRSSGNSHEIWTLPNGGQFTCNTPGRGKGKSWRNDLATLKRLLNGAIPKYMSDTPSKVDAEDADATLKASRERHKPPPAPLPPHPNACKTPTPKQENDVSWKQINAQSKWSVEEDVTLGKYLETGATAREVAEVMEGRSESAILNRVAKLRKRGLLPKPAPTVAKPAPTVAKPAPPSAKLTSYVRWAEAELDDAAKYRGNGASMADIATYINGIHKNNRSHKSVAAALGLHRPLAPSRPDPEPVSAELRNALVAAALPPPAVSKPAPATPAEPPVDGYELVLRFPAGRSFTAPLSKRQAEEWALRIVSGEV